MKEREQYIPFFLVQLNEARRLTLSLFGQQMGIDYRIAQIDALHKYHAPILLLTGWGSGWEGIAPLAFSFACEGYQVILVSLPGYGDSDNPRSWYYKGSYGDVFRNHAITLRHLLRLAETELEIYQYYFIGHSMGAEILAQLAVMEPGVCKKLVLMNPSGVEPVVGFFRKANLMGRFMSSGARLRCEYFKSWRCQDDYLRPFIEFCGRQKSPWSWDRLCQRRMEFNALCRGTLPEVLKSYTRPVVFFSGDRDTVYPARVGESVLQEVVRTVNLNCVIVDGLPHNPTLFHAEETARIIAEYLP